MTAPLPDPMVPPNADLRDFEYMALDVRRLRDSRFAAQVSGDAFRAGVLLWCAAWHQVPAGSVPDDDIELANLAGYGRFVKEWRKVRDEALIGFVKCSDGRLYHEVVCAKVRDALGARNRHAYEKCCDRIRKKNAERRKTGRKEHGIPTFRQWEEGGMEDGIPPELPPPSAGIPPETPVDSTGVPAENALIGKGEGSGSEREVKTNPPEAARIGASTIPDPAKVDRAAPPALPDPEVSPTRRGAVAGVLRSLGITCTYAHPTVCEWASKGVTDEQIREAVQVARMRKPLPEPIPIAYLVPIVRELHDRPIDAGGSRERDWAYIFGETDTRATA